MHRNYTYNRNNNCMVVCYSYNNIFLIILLLLDFMLVSLQLIMAIVGKRKMYVLYELAWHDFPCCFTVWPAESYSCSCRMISNKSFLMLTTDNEITSVHRAQITSEPPGTGNGQSSYFLSNAGNDSEAGDGWELRFCVVIKNCKPVL